MNNKYFKLSFMIIIMSFGCSSEEGSVDLYNVNISDCKNNYAIENIIDSTYYLHLETHDKSAISRIDKIIIHNGIYYILDSKFGSIFVYDNAGGYLNKLNRLGKGKGEYIKIKDFFISEGKYLEVQDLRQRKIIRYKLEDFTFLGEVSFGNVMCREILPVRNGYLCYNYNDDPDKSSKSGLWLIGKSGKFIKQILEFNSYYEVFSDASRLWYYKGEPHFYSVLSDKLYRYDENSDQLNLLLDFKYENYKMMSDISDGLITDNDVDLVNFDFREFSGYYWSSTLASYEISKANDNQMLPIKEVLIRKKDSTSFCFDYLNSESNAVLSPPAIISNAEDILIMPIYGDMIEYIKMQDKGSAEYREFIDRDINDNPSLKIMSIKR